jgi:hypothetical protein
VRHRRDGISRKVRFPMPRIHAARLMMIIPP